VSSIQAPDGKLYESTWNAGTADAVSAVLMHDTLMNEFVLDTATASGTDWVVTMPTKRFYVSDGRGLARLFQRNFNGSVGSCDEVRLNLWDREEKSFTYPPRSTLGEPVPFYLLCWSANVVRFGWIPGVSVAPPPAEGDVFGSANGIVYVPASPPYLLPRTSVGSPFRNGWMNLTFLPSVPIPVDLHKLINAGATSISGRGQPTTTGNSTTYVGLPVIGFAVSSFTNGTLVLGSQRVLSN
jgi:hypothetical protein